MGTDLTGKTAVITGGTDGIGKEIALALARRGIAVIVIGRDPDKDAGCELVLRQAAGHADVHFVQADLALVREVDRVADLISARWSTLDYLVLNAGVIHGGRRLTSEGIESHFALGYLGRFRMAMRLLPLLEAAGRPRAAACILQIGGAANGGTIRFEDVNLTASFGLVRVIRQLAQAQDTFTVELARRLDERNPVPRVTAACLKIGVVRTNIRRTFPRWMKVLVPLLMDPFLALAPAQAAAAAVRLLLAEELEGRTGTLFRYIRAFKPFAPDAQTLDPVMGRRLWELSERLIAQARGDTAPTA